MYAKLSVDMLDSTIWMEADHIVRVWITILLLKDMDGFVNKPIPGIAQRARVTMDQCLDAIAKLEAPDPHSRTKTEGGRRIIRITDEETLWWVVNHEKYRSMRNAEQKRAYNREYMRQYRARKKLIEQGKLDERKEKLHELSHTDADADTDTEEHTCAPRDLDARHGSIPFEEFWELYPKKKSKKKARVSWENLTVKNQQAAMAVLPEHILGWNDPKYIPLPTTWLNQERWNDELDSAEEDYFQKELRRAEREERERAELQP